VVLPFFPQEFNNGRNLSRFPVRVLFGVFLVVVLEEVDVIFVLQLAFHSFWGKRRILDQLFFLFRCG
jgi:hypothetical protein